MICETNWILQQILQVLPAKISGEYPAWSYNADSVIRPKAIELYKEMFGKEPTVETTQRRSGNVESYSERRMILISFLSDRN